MISFGAYNELEVVFGATLIFEIYQQNDNERKMKANREELNFIKILYLNDTDNMDSYYLRLPGCLYKDHCTLKEFMDLTKDLIASEKDLKKECKNQKNIEEESADTISMDNGINYR